MRENTHFVYPSKKKHTPNSKFWSIWLMHHQGIRKCCYRWLGDDNEAIEEALSITIEKALSHFDKNETFQVKDNYFSWFCRIAHNTCMDKYRYEQKQRDLVENVRSVPNYYYFSENQGGDIENMVDAQESFNRLEKYLSRLPSELKQAIEFKFLGQMEYSEMAEILSISQENARKRVQLARKKLRALLGRA